MKRFLFILALVCMTHMSSFSQNGLNFGGSIGLPINGSDLDFTLGLTADINYLFEVHPQFSLGLASGYGIGFGDSYYIGPLIGEIDVEDYEYIPVALAGRHYVGDRLVFGTDVGYAIAMSDLDDGGFYFRPMVGFNLNDVMQLNVNYVGISDYYYWSTLNLGFTFNLN